MDSSAAGSGPIQLRVVHRCFHVQSYTLPAWLDEEARWHVTSHLCGQDCSHCALDLTGSDPGPGEQLAPASRHLWTNGTWRIHALRECV
jgi:hypothetical protein